MALLQIEADQVKVEGAGVLLDSFNIGRLILFTFSKNPIDYSKNWH